MYIYFLRLSTMHLFLLIYNNTIVIYIYIPTQTKSYLINPKQFLQTTTQTLTSLSFFLLFQWVLLNFFLLLAVVWESYKLKTWNLSPDVPSLLDTSLLDTIFLLETTKQFSLTPEKSPPNPTSLGTSPSPWIVMEAKTPWTT